jgi:uncharacterized cysteine cluster protein YcgN (CxxCxxCC family)
MVIKIILKHVRCGKLETTCKCSDYTRQTNCNTSLYCTSVHQTNVLTIEITLQITRSELVQKVIKVHDLA